MTAWRLPAAALALASCALAVPARASDATTDVEVSRITLKLPGDAGWAVSEALPFGMAVQDKGLAVGGQTRLLVAGQPGTRDELVLLVTATRGQGGITMHGECEPADHLYVHKYNRGISTYIPLQCLRVAGPVRVLPEDLPTIDETLGRAMVAQKVVPPPGGYVVMLTVSNDNGAMVEITGLVGTHLVGLDAKPASATLPEGMPPAIAAWADKLGDEALGTLSSWSGRMTVPPVVFKAPARPGQPLNTAQKD